MTLSDLSIRRPVLASVMSLLVIVAGAVAYFQLPVREYPDIDLPLVSVTTVYPGASPEVVEATITEPLEQTLNGVDEIRSVRSSSSFGISSITVEFRSGRDLDFAANDVTNALQRALGELPLEAERPVVAKAGANARPIMWLHVKGEGYPEQDLEDIAERIVKTPLQTLPGVANIFIGGRRYAMRIWLDPARMAARGIDARDVRRAIVESNLQISAGQIEGTTRKFTVLGDTTIDDPAVYKDLVLREDGDRRVRIRDVAEVELGSESYQTTARFNGETIVGVGIVRQSRSNELEVSRAVRRAMPGIRQVLPPGVTLDMAVDNTIFVEASLRQVAWTLLLVLVLVVAVNLFFLHSPRATAITSVAIPVALVGTFTAMQALGFSLNVLSLLALLLVIGLLVDDAIVVLENVYRRQEGGERPLAAARNGTRQVGFAVIATTTATVAVLIPLSLMTGNTGRLFREFALTMAAAVVLSTFVALSLVPALCSRYLRVAARQGRVARVIESVLHGAAAAYKRALGGALRRPVRIGLLIVAIVAGMVAVGGRLPQVFVPTEDRGSVVTIIRAPEGATLAFTDRALRIVEERFHEIPEVEGFFGAIGLPIGGPPSTSSAIVFARLRHWDERDRKQQEIVASLFPEFSAIPYALAFPINVPSLGQGSQSDVQVVLRSPTATLEELGSVAAAALARVRGVPGLVNVDSDLRLEDPQLNIRLDRELAADIGVPIAVVADSLRLLVAQGPADEFIMRAKQYDVVTALAARFRAEPDQLGVIHVRAMDGTMVPLSTLVRLEPRIGPSTLNHFNLQRSATISASLAPEAGLGEALEQVQTIVEEELRPGFTTALDGPSREFVEAGRQVFITFGVALLVIYLVLAAQFESFVHPLTVMFSVPLAGLGAFLSLWLTGGSFNIYSEVGLILLVGLVTKNSILLVDFANQERARGQDLLPALREAGRVRFRPILMTSTTSILGAMPLALATGAGEESRSAIGIVIVGGLLFSTVFTLVIIPVVHGGVIRVAERLGIGTIPPKVDLGTPEESVG